MRDSTSRTEALSQASVFSGAKSPNFYADLDGTAEAAPFQNRFVRELLVADRCFPGDAPGCWCRRIRLNHCGSLFWAPPHESGAPVVSSTSG